MKKLVLVLSLLPSFTLLAQDSEKKFEKWPDRPETLRTPPKSYLKYMKTVVKIKIFGKSNRKK